MATVTNNPTDQEDDITRCARPGCACKVEPGQAYCSTGCEEQPDDEACNCGHPDCMPEAKGGGL